MGMNEMSEAMNLQRAEDETAVSSAISLKDYCETHECPDCIFYCNALHAEGCCIKGEPWKILTKPFMQNYEKKYASDFDA